MQKHQESIAAFNDDEPIKESKKRLAKIEKELNKNLIAWRDAPDQSMKEAYLKMYQQNKNQKDELEKEIENFSKQQKNAADLEEEILGIKEHIEKLKKVETINRNVVENFIDRIIVYGDGKIMVILKFGTTYESVIKPHYEIMYNMDVLNSYNIQFISSEPKISIDWQKTLTFHPLLERCSDRPASVHTQQIIPQKVRIVPESGFGILLYVMLSSKCQIGPFPF